MQGILVVGVNDAIMQKANCHCNIYCDGITVVHMRLLSGSWTSMTTQSLVRRNAELSTALTYQNYIEKAQRCRLNFDLFLLGLLFRFMI